MKRPPLGAYVHLPWCERKCPYCDFNSHVVDSLPETAYVDALLADLAHEYADESRPLSSIFIGGGTPSLFSVAAIARLLDGLHSVAMVVEGAEITLEANPGSTESAKLSGFARAGVTRFSIGVQSFDDAALERLGRVHDGAAATAALLAATGSGAASFNIDLMHGLPGQDLEQGLADLEHARLAPHLSWYQLTIEPNTRFYSDPPRLPLEELLGDLEERGAARLAGAGFERYEISAWARPGQRCRHNLNYWRFGDYLGIGAGAHGKITMPDGRILRYAKTRQPSDYMSPGGTTRRAVRELGAADRRGEFAMNALRLNDGFTRSLFRDRTGLDDTCLDPVLLPLRADGLLVEEGERIRCSRLGWRFLDDVVARFF